MDDAVTAVYRVKPMHRYVARAALLAWISGSPQVGVTVLASSGHTEWSSDLVFKKPFRLSATSEFMIGLGPTVARTMSGPDRGVTHGLEVVLDFMFWRNKDSGWYLEPGWSRNAGSGERSVSLNGGLLFAWP